MFVDELRESLKSNEKFLAEVKDKSEVLYREELDFYNNMNFIRKLFYEVPTRINAYTESIMTLKGIISGQKAMLRNLR